MDFILCIMFPLELPTAIQDIQIFIAGASKYFTLPISINIMSIDSADPPIGGILPEQVPLLAIKGIDIAIFRTSNDFDFAITIDILGIDLTDNVFGGKVPQFFASFIQAVDLIVTSANNDTRSLAVNRLDAKNSPHPLLTDVFLPFEGAFFRKGGY